MRVAVQPPWIADEDLGVVGPSRGGGRERDVLIDPDEDRVVDED